MSVLLVLMRKEWEDASRNRFVVVSTLLLPTILLTVSLGGLAAIGAIGQDPTRTGPGGLEGLGALCDGLTVSDCAMLHVAQVMQLLFLTLATALPTVMAAYAVVGEKNERTLEPLLATPVSTLELLLAKALAAVVPTVLLTWGSLGVLYVGLVAQIPPALIERLLTPSWIAAMVVLVPLVATLSVLVALGVSSRSTDPRSAQQITGLVTLPLMAPLIAQGFGVMVVQPATVLPAIAVLALIDGVLGWWVVALFERENILTRWSGT
jgi:ABC-2 type transport system permease protein